MIIANDPYRTGTHVNDLLFIRPVFAGSEIVAFVTLKAHHLDMGGSVPGGFSTQKANLYEDGLVVSPRALYKAGKPVQETWTLIFDNSRFGDLLFPDMQTICSNLDLGERLLSETVERYGPEAVLGAMTYVCDAGAERMQRGARGGAGRVVGGRGDHGRRRRRRRRVLPRPRADHEGAATGRRSTSRAAPGRRERR